MMKKFVAVSLVVALLAMVVIVIVSFFVSKPTNTSTATQNTSEATSVNQASDATTTTTELACGTKGGACTVKEIAVHNSSNNCWVIYDGAYYDVTNFVTEHEGGTGAFTASTCGNDITNYLNGSTNSGTTVKKNVHSSSAYSTLTKYKIGPVSQ